MNEQPTPDPMLDEIELERDFCVVALMMRGLSYKQAQAEANEWVDEAHE